MVTTIEELSSLVKVISKNKVKQIDIIGEDENKESLTQELYDLISDESIRSEEDARRFFFKNSPNQDFYLNRIKRKLRNRLLNTLFFIDVNQPKFTEIQKAYYQCYRQATAVKVLIGRGARIPAIALAERTIKKSLKFEFTDITLEMAKNLRMHYSNIESNKIKFKKYRRIIETHAQVYQAELLAEEYYCDLAMNFTSSQSTKPELIEIADRYYLELKDRISTHNSYRFNLYSYLVFALRYEIENDYLNTLGVCKEAISYFESKPNIASKTVIFNFLLKILGCYIITKNFEQGEEIAKRCIEIQPKGSINWLVALDFYVILLFHWNKFDRAYELYILATSHLDSDNQLKGSLERWKIHGAFLSFLIAMGKIKAIERDNKNFRLSKFLNEVPVQSKDKQGINTSILILQILFLLQKGRYDDIIDRTESLKTYVHRYLRRDHTFRSNCFIKMLICLPAANFHIVAVQRKAKKYFELLKSVPINEANQSPEVEIVPYEILWELVLELLDNSFH